MSIMEVEIIPVPQQVLDKAKMISHVLSKENTGARTRNGGDFRDLKGILGQWGVHNYFLKNKVPHEYSQPYVKNQHGDAFDIKLFNKKIDVKCRGWWNQDNFDDFSVLMGEHEKTEAKPCDYYVITTVNHDYKNIYILGLIGYQRLWDSLDPVDNEKLLFPSAGSLSVNKLAAIKNVLVHR